MSVLRCRRRVIVHQTFIPFCPCYSRGIFLICPRALTCRLTAATFPNGEKKKPKILFLLIFLLDQTETTHKKNVFFFLFFSKEIYDWKEETKIRFSPRKLSCMCVEESVYISGDITSMAPSSPLGCLPCVWGCSITGLVSNKFVPHFPPFLFLSSSSLRPYSG